ncbi:MULTISPECIES: acyl-CoA dehydrogenase [unclassified Nocardioides]|uniref:acyl-CoA dehydrogenase n=1 Tax=unclassified Nocardioides TaxID=2615069 RepID=UPI0007039124|nr:MULTISPECIES: acyl-CoA dehydrogenase [unclassified Nocardioides]KQP63489.1 butyryl-CoA dehydrogenase [Nocardioides sp. Leaf285]KQQ39567.1 butyryl-CoA dehydrogenase [Nocardioides sp. Leaf307]
MSHYKSNLRDIEFNLFEVLGRDEILGTGPFAEVDGDTAREILAEVDRLSREELAASYEDSDRNPPVFDPATNTAPIPASFKKSYQAWMDSEYWRLQISEELGGTPAPSSLVWALGELVLGANAPVWMYGAGAPFAGVVHRNGNERDKRIAEIMVERQWGATMVLTEPDAGSDVGAGRAKATPNEDGSWNIEGVKRFITSAEHDMSENIMHLVLARPVGVEGVGGPGTKGLSLFLLPQHHFDHQTGELTGERNGVYVTNVEHKMGIKVSNTCEVTFGDSSVGGGEPAKGWLLGEVHNGIAQMFQVIENARMMVGTKAIATLSTGYLNALDYAKTRQQGADLTQSGDKTAPRVTITHHPDVRRSLMVQKSFSEAMRALVLYTASYQDQVMLAEHAGTTDTDEVKLAAAVNDLLLPIVKGYGSERSWVLLGTESLQTFGGSGFLQEYPIEQYVRDAKIDTLYEGTTAIQGQDFFFRKIVKDQGRALGHLAGQVQAFLDAEGGNGRLKNERALLATALEDTNAMVGHMINDLMSAQDEIRNIYKVGLNTSRLLMALGDVVCGWLLLRQAEVALEKLGGEPSAKDKAFYEGKVAAAQFFAQYNLPKISAERAIAEATGLDLMDLDEASF